MYKASDRHWHLTLDMLGACKTCVVLGYLVQVTKIRTRYRRKRQHVGLLEKFGNVEIRKISKYKKRYISTKCNLQIVYT